MLDMFKTRQNVRQHAPAWAAEAIETYGDDAEAIMTAMEPHYSRPERYAFRQVRKALIRARQDVVSFS